MKKRFATRYNPHPAREYAFKTVGDSMTQQQFKAECNINNIMAKYRKTGLLTHLSKHQGDFGDFSNVTDYRDAYDRVLKAQESFDAIPSELRNRFGNDPGKLIEYLSDPKNHEEAVKFGLMVRRDPPPSTQTQQPKPEPQNEKKTPGEGENNKPAKES